MLFNFPLIENFKIFRSIPGIIKLFINLIKDERIPVFLKIMFAGGILYFFAPMDINPDYIPYFGYLDDLAVLLLVIERFILTTPKDVVKENLSKANLSEDDLTNDLASLSAFLGTRLGNMRKNLDDILNKYTRK